MLKHALNNSSLVLFLDDRRRIVVKQIGDQLTAAAFSSKLG
jgi:hypothetical protein